MPGSRALKTDIEVIVEVEIGRPVPAVWAFVADVERTSDWIEEFQGARTESEGPVGLGTIVRYELGGNRSGTYELVEWDPPRKMAWDGPPLSVTGGAARPRGSHEFLDLGAERTLLTTRYRPELIGLVVLMRAYLKRWLRRQRLKDAEKLKSLLEAQRSG